jgi:hypothetical protein
LTITLLKGIGQAVEVSDMNLPRIVSAIFELQQRQAQRGQKVLRLMG